MATVVMEQISRLFINVQQIRQIPRFLEVRFPTLPCTLKDCDVPRVFREPYIFSGYRPLHQKWRYYFLTLFQRHNEANVSYFFESIASVLIIAAFKIASLELFLTTKGHTRLPSMMVTKVILCASHFLGSTEGEDDAALHPMAFEKLVLEVRHLDQSPSESQLGTAFSKEGGSWEMLVKRTSRRDAGTSDCWNQTEDSMKKQGRESMSVSPTDCAPGGRICAQNGCHSQP
ncbi:MPRAB protein, partial [Polypterus senegalus]|nr:MPRAB protein [Polypterus senegalus]